MKSLSFETAKKLKAAGFSQVPFEDKVPNTKIYVDTLDGKELLYVPTLEELIEACGPVILIQKGNNYYAAPTPNGMSFYPERDGLIDDYFDFQKGHTPSEAVASLYISLYGKKN